jgi:hypothetical protein
MDVVENEYFFFCKVTAVTEAGVVFMMQDLVTSVSGHVV